jgi:predicted lipoprotein with Yx(FWY)xxD motif
MLGVMLCLLAGCGATAGASATTATTAPTGTTTLPDAGAGASTGSAQIRLAATRLGDVLVTGDGHTLYLYTEDLRGRSSRCVGACAHSWHPDIASAVPSAGPGVNAERLRLLPRPDGTEQVAYRGWPLYVYVNDVRPGDVNGAKVGGVWFAVDAEGSPVGG